MAGQPMPRGFVSLNLGAKKHHVSPVVITDAIACGALGGWSKGTSIIINEDDLVAYLDTRLDDPFLMGWTKMKVVE